MWLATALALSGCISTPTAYTREAPMAIYPAGELSGADTWVLGWRIKF